MCAGAKLDSTTNGTRPDKPEHTRQECLPTYAADRLKQARHTENKLDCEILHATVLRKRLNLQGTRLPGLSRSILLFLPSAAGEAGSGRARCRVPCTVSPTDETLKGVLASATAHCPAQGYPVAQTDGKVDRGVSAVFVSFLRQCPPASRKDLSQGLPHKRSCEEIKELTDLTVVALVLELPATCSNCSLSVFFGSACHNKPYL